MPTWSSEQDLKFEAERTRPAVELAARVKVESPGRVIDLGCGPGNSTAVLARRWPQASLTGLDSSSAMLDTAKAALPSCDWVQADIAAWSAGVHPPFDVVFANASLQWVADHAVVFPRLLAAAGNDGAFAVQMPANFDAVPHVLMRDIAARPAWRGRTA